MSNTNRAHVSLDRMKQYMVLRGLRPNTVNTFFRCARGFLNHVGKVPAKITTEDVEGLLFESASRPAITRPPGSTHSPRYDHQPHNPAYIRRPRSPPFPEPDSDRIGARTAKLPCKRFIHPVFAVMRAPPRLRSTTANPASSVN
jgi:hypothetical protein